MFRGFFTKVVAPVASKLSYAAGVILSPITSPISGSLTLDEAWKLLRSQGDVSAITGSMIDRAKQDPNGVSVRYFGRLVGHFAVVVPTLKDNTVFLRNLLQNLDQQEGSRGFFEFADEITGVKTLVAQTGKDAMIPRHLFHQHVVRSSSMELFLDVASEMMTKEIAKDEKFIDLGKTMLFVVRSTLAKVILGIDNFSASLGSVYDKSTEYAKRRAELTFLSGDKSKAKFALKAAQDAYEALVNEIFDKNFDVIMQAIESGRKSENLFATEVVNVLKKEKPYTEQQGGLRQQVKDILRNHSFIKSFSIALVPADNLANAFTEGLLKLKCLFRARNFDLNVKNFLEGLEKELQQLASGKLNSCDLMNKEYMPFLHAFYLEVMRTFDPVLEPLIRYSKKGVQAGDVSLPSGTTVTFPLTSWKDDEKAWKDATDFNPMRFLILDAQGARLNDIAARFGKAIFMPFSSGFRKCPADRLSEEIFKSMLMTFLSNVNIAKSVIGEKAILVKKVVEPVAAVSIVKGFSPK